MELRSRRLVRTGARLGLAVALGAAVLAGGLTQAQPGGQPPKKDGPQAKPGVSVNDARAYRGYTLVAPMNSTKAHLIDLDGRVVKTWETGVTPGASTYLLDNGNLLRTGNIGSKGKLNGAAQGGRVLEINWDGETVWDYTYATETSQPHHDICKMPNGNVLMIVWDKKTKDEAVAAGRRPDTVRGDHLMADAIIEVKPTGKTSGEIVWEWHTWDHLVQDHDKTKANYGNVAAKAELVDINFGSGALAAMIANKDDLQKLRDLGYVGGATPPPKKDAKGPDGKQPDGKGPDGKGPFGKGGPGGISPDWTHFNSVAYNADLDQIVISVHEFSEIWVLDHSTTKAEAAGHKGGKHGKGGDLIYRWGNPRAYRSGTNADQRLFAQHNAHWIPKGLPGEGHLLVFNNGGRRPDGSYSSVDEIVLPMGPDGKYTRKPGLPFGPDKPVWSYTAEKKTDFYAFFVSGAQRLPNGDTLICSGPDSTVFEVTADKQTVWKFVNPGRGAFGPGGFGGGMFVAFPAPGELLPIPVQDQLKLTAEQKKQLGELQKEIDKKLEALMTEEQRKEFKELKDRRPGGPGGPGGFGPPGGFGGPPGGPGGRGPGGGAGGPGGLFRSTRIGADHPALAGKELKPGPKLEELDMKK
jgi:hypothetical protein